jgi:hypothetical protein
MILRAFSHCLTPHPLAPTQAGLTQIPRSKSSSLGGAGRTRRKSFISRTGRAFSFAFRWRSQGGTLGLPFGSLPAPRDWPRSLTPPLAHSFPGSSPGSNAPNPLAGDWAGMPVMKIPRDLPCPFAFPRDWGLSPGLHTASLRAKLTVERNEKYGPRAMALWNWNGETAGSKPDPASPEGRQEREPWRPCAEERQRRLSDNRDLDKEV